MAFRHIHFGTYPTSDDEIALHSFAAEKANLKVGDKPKSSTRTAERRNGNRYLRSGFLACRCHHHRYSTIFGQTYATQQSDDPDKTDQIGIYGNLKTPLDEQAQQELADRINKALPAGSKAQCHHRQPAARRVDPIRAGGTGLRSAIDSYFRGNCPVRGLVHHREHVLDDRARINARLRSAAINRSSPAQVFTTVIVQAIVLGVVGSGIGIGLGWGMVKGIVAMMGQMGTPMTGSSNPSVSDMLVGLAVA